MKWHVVKCTGSYEEPLPESPEFDDMEEAFAWIKEFVRKNPDAIKGPLQHLKPKMVPIKVVAGSETIGDE